MREKLLPELSIWLESVGDLRGLSEVGCVGAGLDERHLDPKRFHFLRQRFVQRFHGPFRGAIEAYKWQRRNPEAARNPENVTVPLLPQQRQSCPQDADHAEVVRVEQAVDLLVARLLGGGEQARAGIVD